MSDYNRYSPTATNVSLPEMIKVGRTFPDSRSTVSRARELFILMGDLERISEGGYLRTRCESCDEVEW
jgi:hypothetical protein